MSSGYVIWAPEVPVNVRYHLFHKQLVSTFIWMCLRLSGSVLTVVFFFISGVYRVLHWSSSRKTISCSQQKLSDIFVFLRTLKNDRVMVKKLIFQGLGQNFEIKISFVAVTLSFLRIRKNKKISKQLVLSFLTFFVKSSLLQDELYF